MTWSAERITVVDDRQKKVNPKRRVFKITNNFQKARVMLWQSTVLRRLWHRITCYTARCKPLTSTKNRKVRLEFAKNHKGEPEEFWNGVYGPMRQNLIYDDSSRMNLEGYKTILPTNIQENTTRSLGSASYCIRTMTQNTMPAQSRNLYGKEMESLRFPKSISMYKSDWTLI